MNMFVPLIALHSTRTNALPGSLRVRPRISRIVSAALRSVPDSNASTGCGWSVRRSRSDSLRKLRKS